MRLLRILLVAVGIASLLWGLYPRRRPAGVEAGARVVEIVYMGPGGPISGAMADAVREFERASEKAHAADP
ncbi:MAG: hypothetical protein FJ279_11205, partial [Planctomycetes bacterium]|nr:hypothetical protein [Planctomycetota bacterium]